MTCCERDQCQSKQHLSIFINYVFTSWDKAMKRSCLLQMHMLSLGFVQAQLPWAWYLSWKTGSAVHPSQDAHTGPPLFLTGLLRASPSHWHRHPWHKWLIPPSSAQIALWRKGSSLHSACCAVFMPVPQGLGCIAWEVSHKARPGSHSITLAISFDCL